MKRPLSALTEDALGYLEPKSRSVVVRYYFAEASLAEIADETGATVGAIQQILHRARARMRERLSRSGVDAEILNET